mmetsp:Transcript_33075/g.60641  ORF Transcript_33075/g.60641 Transcript_33075/m.60641 type:complete len:213 (-) Transcript_33075:236-874(-)
MRWSGSSPQEFSHIKSAPHSINFCRTCVEPYKTAQWSAVSPLSSPVVKDARASSNACKAAVASFSAAMWSGVDPCGPHLAFKGSKNCAHRTGASAEWSRSASMTSSVFPTPSSFGAAVGVSWTGSITDIRLSPSAAAALAITFTARAASADAPSWSGVHASRASFTHAATFAFASRRRSATSALSCIAARCRGVLLPSLCMPPSSAGFSPSS